MSTMGVKKQDRLWVMHTVFLLHLPTDKCHKVSQSPCMTPGISGHLKLSKHGMELLIIKKKIQHLMSTDMFIPEVPWYPIHDDFMTCKHVLYYWPFVDSQHKGSVIYSSLLIDDLVQDCGNSISNAMELPQFCTNPLIYYWHWWTMPTIVFLIFYRYL